MNEVQINMSKRILSWFLVLAVGCLVLAVSAAAQTANTTETTNTAQTSATTSTTQQSSGSAPSGVSRPNSGNLNVGPGSHEQGHSWENHVNNREQHQQNRIGNGIKDGQLSAGQATHLENRENQIQERERADEAAHHGRLTPQEKQHFQRAQNKMSKQIHNDRHPK